MRSFLAAPLALVTLAALAAFSSCSRVEELTLAEIEQRLRSAEGDLVSRTEYKPWRGEKYVPGRVGGSWRSAMLSDPKSFNLLIAERDQATNTIVNQMHDSLLDYDYVRREWIPNCAAAELFPDEKAGTLRVVYTLRDDLWWSFYRSDRRVKVTSDDVIFWYDEIEGDPAFQSSAYNGHFQQMPDGTLAPITIERIDDRRFAFNFPRMCAEPFLETNRNFGPRFVFEPAKRERGVQGVLELFSVAADPRAIPSMGMWFLVEYVPSQRLVFKRNPDYWNKDARGAAIPYPEEKVFSIITDENTQYLLFKERKVESYRARPENVEEVVAGAGTEADDYTVFRADGALGAGFWSFNQNPKNAQTPQYEWFTKREFRQAMSCLLNRERIISQTYRGLADPEYHFFSEMNPYFDPEIKLKYLYDPAVALRLLDSIGMRRDASGILRDVKGRVVEFDLTITADSASGSDIASIIVDECKAVGITVRVRPVDFQKLVEQLTETYDWQTIMIGFGANNWPSQGSNAWLSSGNLHLWHPYQKAPATEWEARLDYLFYEGSATIDRDKAKRIWDEFQSIMLEECPVVYLVRPQSFLALRNRWDFSNFYYDNRNNSSGELYKDYVFLREGA